MLYILIGVGAAMVLVERLWPAMDLPRVRNWWARVALVNLIQLGIVVLARLTWDPLTQRVSPTTSSGIRCHVRCPEYRDPGWVRDPTGRCRAISASLIPGRVLDGTGAGS